MVVNSITPTSAISDLSKTLAGCLIESAVEVAQSVEALNDAQLSLLRNTKAFDRQATGSTADPEESPLDESCLSGYSSAQTIDSLDSEDEAEASPLSASLCCTLPGSVEESLQQEQVEDEAGPSSAGAFGKIHCALSSPRQRSRSPSPRKMQTPKQAPTTPCSAHSCFSNKWDAPGETLILLDWDDTLCPTTACESERVANDEPAKAVHVAAVDTFLRTASELGRVVVVTMAQKQWVNDCIEKFLPGVGDLLRELKIDIVSARESITQRIKRCAFSDDRNPSQYLKTRAMEHVIKKFYKSSGLFTVPGRSCKRSWKNIISIGDSAAERLALQDIVFQHVQRGRQGEWKECRCKTILLLEEPEMEQLTKQVTMLPKLLQPLVRYDGDIHVDIKQEDLDLDLAQPCSH